MRTSLRSSPRVSTFEEVNSEKLAHLGCLRNFAPTTLPDQGGFRPDQRQVGLDVVPST